MEKKLIYKQRELKDCGACCLASIITYYKGYVPVSVIKEETFTGVNGTTAYHIIKAAQQYGFDSIGLKVENLNDPRILLPAIAHVHLANSLDHFVVIYAINKNTVTLMDPSCGKKVISLDEFLSMWTNVIINFTPKTPILKLKQTRPLKSLIQNLINDNKKIFLHLLLGSISLSVVSIIANYFYEVGMKAIEKRSEILLYQIIFVFTIITILKVIFNSLREYYQIYLHKNIDFKIYDEFITHTINLPLSVVKSRTSGEILSRLQDLKEIKYLISEILISLFIDATLATVSAFLLYRNNAKLFFILCLVLLIYFTLSLIFTKATFQKALKNIEEETNFNADILEKLENIESIKNTNTSAIFLKGLKTSMATYLSDNFFFSKTYLYQNITQNTISEVGLFSLTSYAFILIFQGNLNIASYLTFNAFIVYLLQPMKDTINLLPKYNYIKALLIKLNEYLALHEENLFTYEENFQNGLIEFQNISYSFNNYHNVLDNTNITIDSGSKVFLKGPSGSGKSTLCKLLFRHLNPNNGNILIGGVNIQDYHLNTIRDNITYVSQHEELFNDTLRNNITTYQSYSLEKINQVIQICELNPVVEHLPYRLDSLIIKDAQNLSGGEKQRLVLARALIQDKPILILDEALSEVSFSQEKSIIKRIQDAYPSKTIIYVSHKNVSNLFEKTISIGGTNECKC